MLHGISTTLDANGLGMEVFRGYIWDRATSVRMCGCSYWTPTVTLNLFQGLSCSGFLRA